MITFFKKIFGSFLNIESFSGILLLSLAGLAMYMANSHWQSIYETILHFPFVLTLGTYILKTNLHEFINEGLMALFFFVVGMEVKREFLEGELSSPKKAALPIIAAIGGSLVPAAIYYFFNKDLSSEVGWGIPMATDIAFAIGILSLMSRKVPFALKIFLLCLAIIDDILAVLVIALFYSGNISGPFLSLFAIVCLSIILYFKFNLHNSFVLAALSIALWFCVYHSGIHATLSGVILGFLIPHRRRFTGKQAIDAMNRAFLKGKEPTIQKVKELGKMVHHTEASLKHLITIFHPYVSYIILPLFAFTNAGITLKSINLEQWISNPISYGVILGLCLGKPIGITVFSFLAHLLKIASLPDNVNWRQIIAVGCLGGIGFTMSLFITNLSFDVLSESHSFAKLSVTVSSAFCGIVGLIILSFGKNLPKSKLKRTAS